MEISYPVWLPKTFGSQQNADEMNGLVQVLQNHAENISEQHKRLVASSGGIYPGKISTTSTLPSDLSQGVFLVSQPGTYKNFGNVVLPAADSTNNYMGFIFWDGTSFSLDYFPIAKPDMTAVNSAIDKMDDFINDYSIENTFVPTSEKLSKSHAISDYFFNKKKVGSEGSYVIVDGILKYTSKEFKSSTIVDSNDTDLYLCPVNQVTNFYISALADSSTNRRAIYAFDKDKKYIGTSTSYIQNFLDNGTLTNKKIVPSSFIGSNVAYIGYNNLKTNTNTGVYTYGATTVYGKIKSSLVDIYKKYTVRNLIPLNYGSFQISKSMDSSGVISDNSGYILNFIKHSDISDGVLNIIFNTTFPFINILDSNKKIIESKSYTAGVNYEIDLTTLGGTYIAFSLSAPSPSLAEFTLTFSEKNKQPIYNYFDFANAKTDRSLLSQSVNIQNFIDTIYANGGGTAYFPAGVYNLTTPIKLKSKVSIKGDGEYLTVFKPRGRNSAFIGGTAGDATSVTENVNYYDFCIDGEHQTLGTAAYSSDIKGMYIVYLKNVTFRNLRIINTGATGLGCDFFQNGLIENVRADNCGRLADLTASSAPGASGIGIGTGAFMRGNETLTISNCHANNCGQNGIFIERQADESFSVDTPTGTTVIGCTAEGNRIGFGCSGNDNLIFIGCTAFGNHHANFAYDIGTMNRASSVGKFVKYIGCISKKAGKFMPENYPLYSGDTNGYGWYIKGNYDGIELTNCDSSENLKDGFFVKAGIKNIYINGGRFAENTENGINLNGVIDKFKISPSVVENNILDGIKINGNMSNGFFKDFISTSNKGYGVNKVTGTLTNVIIKELLAYSNVLGQFNNINV